MEKDRAGYTFREKNRAEAPGFLDYFFLCCIMMGQTGAVRRKGQGMEKNKRKWIRIAVAALAALAAVLAVLVCVYMAWEEAPEVASTPEPTATAAPVRAQPDPTPEPMPDGLPFDTQRQDGVYTILLVGSDQISGNTDTIVVGRIDTQRHAMDFVSIPRDTIINVDWSIRKINSVYAGSLNHGGTGIDALSMHIRRLLGFDVDCYAVLNLDTFMKVIDSMGGVDFYVPFNMDYDDDAQRLYIHLEQGQQHLNGYQAMGLCRFRADYISGDMGRIEMQQAFLKACAEQFIRLGNIPNARAVIETLSEDLSTDLSAANIAYFLRQALLCKSEDVHFHIMPCGDSALQGYSYAIPRLGEWLELVNNCLNPYDAPVGYGNVDIVYYTGSGYAATGGLQGAWYYTEPVEPVPVTPSLPAPEPKSEGPTIIEVTPPPQTPPTTEEPQPAEEPQPTPMPQPTPPPEDAETPDFALRLGTETVLGEP